MENEHFKSYDSEMENEHFKPQYISINRLNVMVIGTRQWWHIDSTSFRIMYMGTLTNLNAVPYFGMSTKGTLPSTWYVKKDASVKYQVYHHIP